MQLLNDSFQTGENDALILEQWCKVVEMADASIDKRINSSNVYLTIEVALIAVISFVNSWWNYAVAIVGVLVAVVWYISLKSYRVLSQTKYQVINEIEEMLPVKPFNYEWQLLNTQRKYHQVTFLEKSLPVIFGLLCIAIIIGLICSANNGALN